MAGASAEGTAAPSVVWFRRDLRVRDNPALAAGAAAGAVVPVFVWAPEEEGQFQSGRCSRWWLKQSLEAFAGTLDALGAKLVIRRSAEMLAALLEVCEESGACPHPPRKPASRAAERAKAPDWTVPRSQPQNIPSARSA